MFVSFFPAPRMFFWSAAIWALIAVLFWFFVARDLGYIVGLENPPEGTPPIIGVSVFWSKPFLWFYIYYARGRRHCSPHSGAASRRIPGSTGRSSARR